MPRRLTWTILLALLALVVLTAACGGKDQDADTVPEPPTREEAEPAPPVEEPPVQEVTEPFPAEPVDTGDAEDAEPTIDELNRQGVLATVFFAFDSSELTDAARGTLRENSAWLKNNSQYRVVIEGHCDERGTIEYNLALGDRRAGAVRDYLSSLGVSASRMRVVSYGEERPADPGHGESAWAKNRRAAFVIEG